MFREKTTDQLERYRKQLLWKKRLALIVVFLAAIGIALVSAGIGSIHISIGEIIKALFGMGDSQVLKRLS